MTIWIFTGGRPSNSAKELASCEGFRRMVAGKKYRANDVIVNWGTTKEFPVNSPLVLNTPEAVKRAANKFFTFGSLAGAFVPTVPWTANMAVAKEWQEAGYVVVARKILTGHSGAGIIIVEQGEDIPEVPLYTRYVNKVREFRVHATRLGIIDTQQKVRDPKVEPKSWKVRSHDNGFIFARNNIQQNAERDALAIQAVTVLGLDFGAVDIVEDKKGNFYVLEVNTAPGLEGQTIGAYTVGLTALLDGEAGTKAASEPVEQAARVRVGNANNPAVGAGGDHHAAVEPAPKHLVNYIFNE